MPTHTHITLAGTLLAVPLSQFIQCEAVELIGDEDPIVLGGDEEPAVLGVDEEPTVLGVDEEPIGDEEPRSFPGSSPVAKLEELGKRIFFDEISNPADRMGCATCHDPTAGWTFRDSETNLGPVGIRGANPYTRGSLKPTTIAYASFVPKFHECPFGVPELCGGLFWNGRAEGVGKKLFAGATTPVGSEVFEFKKGNFRGSSLKYLYRRFLGPLADQAFNPFSSPFEQNIPNQKVCEHVAKSEYAALFKSVWGEAIDCSNNLYGWSKKFRAHDVNFRRITVALAAFQSSDEVNSFSSKRDKALAADLDGKFPLDGFTEQENLGHDLFYNTRPNPFGGPTLPNGEPNDPPRPDLPVTNCSFCHVSSKDPEMRRQGTDPEERYTDDAYHNIGLPKNWEIPVNKFAPNAHELLAGHTGQIDQIDENGDPVLDHRGFARTPTLRNVDARPSKYFVKAFMHNGWLKSLESVVHFYNTANVNGETAKYYGVKRCPKWITTVEEALKRNCWPKPEFEGTAAIGTPLVGDLHLSAKQEAAIVAYLKTFTDTETVKPPSSHHWGHDY